MWNPNSQCKVCLSYWDVGIVYWHVRSLLARWYEREQEVHQAHYWSLADSGLLHKERSTPRSPIREERRLRVLRRESAQKKCKKRDFLNIHDSFIRDARFQDHDRIGSHWRSDSWNGQIGERGSHTPLHSRWNSGVSKQLLDPFEFCWFRHDARKASSWFQRSVVNLASPQEYRGSSLLPKLVAKLFLVLEAMARFLVASLIWDITATMDLTLMEIGNLRKQWMVLFTCGMSLKTNLVQNLQWSIR